MSSQGSKLTPQQHALVESGLPLVQTLARRRARNHAGVTVDDLRSVGYEVLVKLAPSYDPSEGEFDAYTAKRVRGAMQDFIRTASRTYRRESGVVERLDPVEPLAEQTIEQALEASPEDDRMSIIDSLDPSLSGASASALLSAAGEDETVNQLDNVRALRAVRGFATTLGEPDKTIFAGIFQAGKGVEEIVAEVGVSARTVKRVTQSLRLQLTELLLR